MSTALSTVEIEEKVFELAQRKARVYSDSSLVPKEYQKNIGNVLIAQNMAARMGADPLMVMQNLYIVHGKPGWSAQFLIACFNECGRFAAIKYRFVGTPGQDDYGCIAYTTEIASGELIEGVLVTIGMAKAEGWHGKAGSKWKTIPDLMMRYRAATFLVRCTAPEIGLGLQTREEIYDTVEGRVIDRHSSAIESTDDLTALLSKSQEGATLAIEQAEGGEDFAARIAAADSAAGLREIRREVMAAEVTAATDAALEQIADRMEELEPA